MLWFYSIALPTILLAVAWALIALPSPKTGAAPRAGPARPRTLLPRCRLLLLHAPPALQSHLPNCYLPKSGCHRPRPPPPAGWFVRLDVGLAWACALATLVLVPVDVATVLLGVPAPAQLHIWWSAAYW